MTKFSDLGLGEQVLKAIAETGYDTPTAIQEQAIPVALTGLDVLGIAQTGTGKTAAFTLPISGFLPLKCLAMISARCASSLA